MLERDPRVLINDSVFGYYSAEIEDSVVGPQESHPPRPRFPHLYYFCTPPLPVIKRRRRVNDNIVRSNRAAKGKRSNIEADQGGGRKKIATELHLLDAHLLARLNLPLDSPFTCEL
jgi:hypothetical protein